MCAAAASPYPVWVKSRHVSWLTPSWNVDWPCQYPTISSRVSMPLPGGVLGNAPSVVR